MSPFASPSVTSSHDACVPPRTGDSASIISIVDGAVAAHIRWMRLRDLSPNTVRLRRTVLGLLAAYLARPLLDATPDDLDRWQDALAMLSVQTRNKYVSQVRNFYAWAVEYRHIETDPSIVLVLPRVPSGLPRPISEARLEAVLALAPGQLRIWFELAAFEGARAGEIAVMDQTDVLRDEVVPLLVLHGKGGKTRAVPLAPSVDRALSAPGLPTRGRLFRKRNGTPVTPRYVSRAANNWLHGHGFPETIHQFRHRFGTVALEQSGNLREVQELMGHESPATTAIYTRVTLARSAPLLAAIDHPLLRPVQDTGS